jgi:hypothetical protein
VPELLETLLAKQAITEVLHRYCYAVDRIDHQLGSEVWHPDGLAHYENIFDGSGQSFVDWVMEVHRSADATSHQLSNILIEVAGDGATSESYVTACIRHGPHDVVVRGRYVDTWSRRDGEWRIDERRFHQDITQVFQVTQQFPPGRAST